MRTLKSMIFLVMIAVTSYAFADVPIVDAYSQPGSGAEDSNLNDINQNNSVQVYGAEQTSSLPSSSPSSRSANLPAEQRITILEQQVASSRKSGTN